MYCIFLQDSLYLSDIFRSSHYKKRYNYCEIALKFTIRVSL